MPRKPVLPAVPLKFKEFLDGVLKVKPPTKTKGANTARVRRGLKRKRSTS